MWCDKSRVAGKKNCIFIFFENDGPKKAALMVKVEPRGFEMRHQEQMFAELVIFDKDNDRKLRETFTNTTN